MANANPATDGGGYDREAIKTAILAEFADRKETAKSFENRRENDRSAL
jgi:hypothetical protein